MPSRPNASRPSRAPSPGWTEFWDTKHSIYVNARHDAAHFRRIADDIALCAGARRDARLRLRRGVVRQYRVADAVAV